VLRRPHVQTSARPHEAKRAASTGRFQRDLPERTLEFGSAVLDAVNMLPPNSRGWIIAKQLGRSGTAIGANIREADHALTDAVFINSWSIARREASETEYWLLLCRKQSLLDESVLEQLLGEVRELLRILTVIVKRSQAHLLRRDRGAP
jgi:four helix bundle protein